MRLSFMTIVVILVLAWFSLGSAKAGPLGLFAPRKGCNGAQAAPAACGQAAPAAGCGNARTVNRPKILGKRGC